MAEVRRRKGENEDAAEAALASSAADSSDHVSHIPELLKKN